MPNETTNDLHDFMHQLSNEMAAEYDRIQKRALEDPGTAGDQGEENWAELLRGWLPRTYEVVTKGQIMSEDGRTSQQIDVLVLKSIYPEKLITKKRYLAAGVAAAFECKTTLKAAHIEQAVKTCTEIKNLYSAREGTPYRELHAPIVYGLLAHSHSWKQPNSTPEENVLQKLRLSDVYFALHPRLGLNLLCVADLGAWVLAKITFIPEISSSESRASPERYQNANVKSMYLKHTPYRKDRRRDFTPIGSLITNLTEFLAWEDPTLRDIARYYRNTKIGGSGPGDFRSWPISIYSEGVLSQIMHGRPLISQGSSWDEWKAIFGAWP